MPDIDELTLVEPYSRIYVAVPNQGMFYSDTLSAISETIIRESLLNSGLKFGKTVSVVGHPNQEELDAGYEWLKDVRPGKLGSARLPSALLAFLSVHSTRYALLFYSEGFEWSEKPGFFFDEDLPIYDSRLYLCVVDSFTGKLVYYKRSEPDAADPLAVKSVQKRIRALLKEFYDKQTG